MGYTFLPAETGTCVRGYAGLTSLKRMRQRFSASSQSWLMMRKVPISATDFCCVGHVRTDAEAFVVVAYLHYAHRLRSIVGQALQVETAAGLLLRDEFRGDVQVSADDFVHGILQPLHVFFRRLLLQAVVQLAFFPFDVGRYRPSASLSCGCCSMSVSFLTGFLYLAAKIKVGTKYQKISPSELRQTGSKNVFLL